MADAKGWNGKSKFKLTWCHGKQRMQEDRKETLEIIKWLLTEALKATTTALDKRENR